MPRNLSKVVALCLACAALLALLSRLFADDKADDAEGPQPPLLSVAPREPQPGDDELRKLLVARYNAAVSELQARYEEYKIGVVSLDALVGAAQRLATSGRELNDQPAALLAFQEQYFELAQHIEKMQEVLTEAGRSRVAELQRARYMRLDAEIQLLRAKRGSATGKPKSK